MAQGKVEICGVNTAKLPILDVIRRRKLCLRVSRQGMKQAKEQYIKGNLRLVLSVIKTVRYIAMRTRMICFRSDVSV